MQILRGLIARSLMIGFVALISVLVMISVISGWSAEASRIAVARGSSRFQQALLSARLRSETLALAELLHQYLIHSSDTAHLQLAIQTQQQELDRLLEEIENHIDPAYEQETSLVRVARQRLDAFNTQAENILVVRQNSQSLDSATQIQIDQQLDEFRRPLLEALQDLEAYESQQIQLVTDQLKRIIATAQNIVLFTSLAVILTSILLANMVVRRLIHPLSLLRQGIERIRSGTLDHTIPITTKDEMGDLAGALNSMAAEINQSRLQLQEYAHTLEDQVNERTFEAEQRAMQAHTAAEITQAASGMLDVEELLRMSVNLIQQRFNLYYVGLFLLDESHRAARLRAGTGEAGRIMLENEHQLPLDTNSMIGRCMVEKEPQVELDISGSTRRYHNPILPNTRSELALPLITQSEVTGALTVQSESPKAFKESDITILQTMAGQLANVIGNARLYQQVEWEKTQAEKANRAKSFFLANMSHEIRTPLNSILGFTALLQSEENLTPAQRENVMIVHRSSEALLSLINNILDLSKIEAGRMELNENAFNLYHLLDNLKDLFRLRALDKKLKLTIERAPDLPQFVVADEGKLRQVLINLLGNALKFTQSGWVQVFARAATQAEIEALEEDTNLKGLWLLFSVEDSGPGISPEDLECIFEPFFQAANSHASHPGTGLGLTISSQYLHLMGGKIQVRSAPGEGSTFSVLVPTKPTGQVEQRAPFPPQAGEDAASAFETGDWVMKMAEQSARQASGGAWEAVPTEEITRLRQAILLGDVDQIRAMIQQMRAIQPALAEMLLGYANRFDLRGLMAQLPDRRTREDEGFQHDHKA